VALRVGYEGSCLTGFFRCCVGKVNAKLEKGIFRPGGMLGYEMTFFVEG